MTEQSELVKVYVQLLESIFDYNSRVPSIIKMELFNQTQLLEAQGVRVKFVSCIFHHTVQILVASTILDDVIDANQHILKEFDSHIDEGFTSFQYYPTDDELEIIAEIFIKERTNVIEFSRFRAS
jgi:hypothetical protein